MFRPARTLLLFVSMISWSGCEVVGAPATSEAQPSAQVDLVAAAVSGDESGAAADQLRAQGRAGLKRLLEAYADAGSPADPDWLRAIDRVAGQRDAVASGLYWETDLGAAQAKARERGVPVLSLRMLGRLTDELSCANSRFFRTLLYPDPKLGPWLDEHFVLHWSSERPVPVVEIDYGDGRVVRTTTTGNSAHYVLDGDGRVLDVLPGLYDAETFRARLQEVVALHGDLPRDARVRREAIATFHGDEARRLDGLNRTMVGSMRVSAGPQRALLDYLGAVSAPSTGSVTAALDAQPITVSKAAVEVPLLKQLDGRLGPLPDLRPSDALLRSLAGAPVSLSPRSVALIERDRPRGPSESQDEYASRLQTVLFRTKADLAYDTFLNEHRLHLEIHRWFAQGEVDGDFTSLNARIYRDLFNTPADNPWLGLIDPTAYDGLPESGITSWSG